ncbi:conserved repeat protein [Rivularia sp. PCC 7116]|uniref:isopeptide-forming domain-containing fimbrial protein n=1 Tax=Rivularia sp. PCC 7116 TaxID=373994 RepID=UPI00029EC4B3|nr:isopeptide-forming domain-containing fimbrial protein [Rivularia sp. PCC 7116]AFY56042.1 conserved repeat protein [Rivularia sp. PCC 7116]
MHLILQGLYLSDTMIFDAKKKGKINFFSSLFTTIFLLNFWAIPSQAEGSKELVFQGGDRPYIEWSNRETAKISRKTLLKVVVKNGETVNLGSSVHNSFDGRDIVFRGPIPSTTEQICDVKRLDQGGEGLIDKTAKETAGPLPNPDGYTPCQFTVDSTGIYEVEFHSPNPDGGDPPAKSTSEDFPTDNQQQMTVAAWDITVRDEDGNTKNGRVFTNYLAMNMGTVEKSLNSNFFIQTKDGFLYKTSMNGIDPFGFIFFANSRGFIDQTDNSTLYHSANAGQNNFSLDPFLGNVQVQRPDVEDTNTDITHLVFFNRPDAETLNQLNIPLVPAIPITPTNFKFTGGNGGSGNQTVVGVGGNFSFDSTSPGSYEIIIDTDKDNIFDPSKDTVLQNIVTVGSNVVRWDGQDGQGNNLPPRINNDPYDARIRLRTGEYHFPMLDVESNSNGFVIEMLNAPTAFPVGNRFTVYYNDENYTTSNGTDVDLSGSGASNPRNASIGVDSNGGAHKFSNNYGDFKGIDTWAYFPSEATSTNLIITDDKSANVRGTKSVRFLEDKDNSGTVTVGDTVEYTITYSNQSPDFQTDATNFIIQDTLPPQLTYNNSEIVSKTDGNNIILNSSYSGSGALSNSGTLRVNDEIIIKITATINNDNDGDSINNQANATFNTNDSSATSGTALTDADSAGATQDNPPTQGNPFKQIDDDSQNTGNDPSNTADDEPTIITVEKTVVTGSPKVLLVKRITAINGVNFDQFVDDPNSIEDNNSNWPDSDPSDTSSNDFLRGAVNGGLVVPGDELEYTIYFLSIGEKDASKLKICDVIPTYTTFIPTAFNGSTPTDGGLSTANLGIAIAFDSTNYPKNPTAYITNVADSDRGEFFSAGETPPIACSSSNNNGAVVVNIVNKDNVNQDIIPTANVDQTQTKPTNSYGFIRFKVKVN